MPGFWTQNLQLSFHQAVEALYARTENPLAEIDYTEQNTQWIQRGNDSQHVLSLIDELQLVDHIAFLAQTQEGALAISAVCVEETVDGLVLVLAGNSVPTPKTVEGLSHLMDLLEHARTGTFLDLPMTKLSLQDRLFDCVVSLSQDRILQRLRPCWIPTAAFYKHKEAPLWDRLETAMSTDSSSPSEFVNRIRDLTAKMKVLQRKPREEDLPNVLKSLLRSCADVSYADRQRSLEQQLVSGHATLLKGHRRALAQVDKLARYWGLCRDLSKIARRRPYQLLLRRIRLTPLTAPFPSSLPNGAKKKCHTHAEVKIILHYEEHPWKCPPRAIGCSKSACFLCDLLVQKMDKYRISHSHRRLYNQWTIPEVAWMSPTQVEFFQRVVTSMTEDMVRLRKAQPRAALCPLESRAVLPLFGDTPSTASLASGFTAHSKVERYSGITPRLSSILQSALIGSSERLSLGDLPLTKHICLQTPGMHLSLGDLHLDFEFVGLSLGQLHVKMVTADATPLDSTRVVDTLGLPTDRNITISSSGDVRRLLFRLQHFDVSFEIEIIWGPYPGWKSEQKRAINAMGDGFAGRSSTS